MDRNGPDLVNNHSRTCWCPAARTRALVGLPRHPPGHQVLLDVVESIAERSMRARRGENMTGSPRDGPSRAEFKFGRLARFASLPSFPTSLPHESFYTRTNSLYRFLRPATSRQYGRSILQLHGQGERKPRNEVGGENAVRNRAGALGGPLSSRRTSPSLLLASYPLTDTDRAAWSCAGCHLQW